MSDRAPNPIYDHREDPPLNADCDEPETDIDYQDPRAWRPDDPLLKVLF